MASQPKPNSSEALEALRLEAESLVLPLGYEIVALEQGLQGGRRIILYIDFAEPAEDVRISLNDCIKVNDAVDALFESTPLLEGHYTLEVSSPGVERPLRKITDYQRFSGRKARIHTFRPLEAKELQNAIYWETHKKQKNFIGQLQGVSQSSQGDCVRIAIDGQEVTVPLELISKAHLEFVEEKTL